MEREIRMTDDGSPTLYNAGVGECYHSTRGAIEEALHVYVQAAFSLHAGSPLHILEIGFGTGLNALLSLLEARLRARPVYYETIEAYPVPAPLWSVLPYAALVGCPYTCYAQLHELAWGRAHRLDPFFTFFKQEMSLADYVPSQMFDIVYFDAFSPDSQPDMWIPEVFLKLYAAMNPGGMLLTYCSKGTVKQGLRKAGFEVKRLPGAGGKRHMLCAVRR